MNTASRLLAAGAIASAALGASAQTSPVRADQPYAASRPIVDQYVVVFKRGTPNPDALAAQVAREQGAQLLHVYRAALQGFSARMSPQAVEALKRNPVVDVVEQDRTVSLNATQSNATWGLDRIDQRALPLGGTYTYNSSGSGVYAFIIDTGVLTNHVEFTGRLLSGYDAVSGGTLANDCNGHGTHVAGTVAGTVYGVAKSAYVVPVRVLGCTGSGSFSGVIAGVDWVAAQTSMRPAVANMSLGGGYYGPVNTAVAGAVSAGVTMVVAAGNDNADACSYSPASTPSAITVGSTTSSDGRSSFSNFGTCVDIFAPGSSITSAWYTSSTAITTISGTSMASPHVAGAAALVLGASPSATPAAVTQALIDASTPNVVGGAGTGSPNRLLYTASLGTPPGPSLTVVRNGNGTGTVTGSDGLIQCGADCTETYASTTNVTLTATPNAGHAFASWSGGGCSGSASTCDVVVDSAKTVTATFNRITHSLSVTVTKATSRATGSVVSNPAGINCSTSSTGTSTTCSAAFGSGTAVTLTARPGKGSTFTGWTNCPAPSGTSCAVTMDAAKSVTATFRR